MSDRSTLMGIRDYALLRRLWGNALRRNEVSQLNVGDFDEFKPLRSLAEIRGNILALEESSIESGHKILV